jgi:4-amino-4-deoxy-L-arabinose transferase-like glycosyltransferase
VLHTLLVWITTRAGDALWIARLPAFLAGVAIIPATWLAVARIDPARRLLAAALAAGATPLVEYSAQARGYTIFALCA